MRALLSSWSFAADSTCFAFVFHFSGSIFFIHFQFIYIYIFFFVAHSRFHILYFVNSQAKMFAPSSVANFLRQFKLMI